MCYLFHNPIKDFNDEIYVTSQLDKDALNRKQKKPAIKLVLV